jgi:hypothetical protein
LRAAEGGLEGRRRESAGAHGVDDAGVIHPLP